MAPLAQAMDYPRPPDQVKVAIMDDPHINAASAGGGEFYVTTGLLQKAADATAWTSSSAPPASTMLNTLTWLGQTEGTDGGGFFATHPATADRIEALRNVR
jgi:Zn-dependent protease with chaperone function